MADPAYIVDGVLTDGEAWVALAATTRGSDTSSISFTSPEDGSSTDWSQFMDLVLIGYARSTNASTDSDIAYRYGTASGSVDSGSNYIYQLFKADGSSTNQSSTSYSFVNGGTIPAASATANIFGATVAHFFDINSGKYKSALFHTAGDRDGGGWVSLNSNTWNNQGAIKRIDTFPSTGLYLAATRFDLFGILPRMVA